MFYSDPKMIKANICDKQVIIFETNDNHHSSDKTDIRHIARELHNALRNEVVLIFVEVK